MLARADYSTLFVISGVTAALGGLCTVPLQNPEMAVAEL